MGRCLKSFFRLSVLGGLGFLLTTGQALNAQTIRCGTDQLNAPVPENSVRKKDLQPGYDVSNQDYHVIPVVVHNFYEGFRDSLAPGLIKSQIAVLNDDFGRSGDFRDASNAQGADTRIRFCLAKRNPDGKPTNGINYRKVNNAAISFDNEGAIKDALRWPTDRYLNIWVVSEIQNDNPRQRVQGYAYLPPNAANEDKDGIVMDHRYFGKNNPRTRFYSSGHVATHEVGHYLNLFHPWGPNPESGCGEDDRVDDTPLCTGPFEKIRDPDPCEPDRKHECRGFDRMTSNYMEYSIDQCMKAFTPGQRERMRNAIANYRSELVSFTNLQNAGCTKTFDTLNSRKSASEDLYPQVNAFPNPASEQIFINTLSKERQVLTATLYRASGQQVRRLSLANFRTGRTAMQVADLRPGVYILRVAFADTVKEQKVIIQP